MPANAELGVLGQRSSTWLARLLLEEIRGHNVLELAVAGAAGNLGCEGDP